MGKVQSASGGALNVVMLRGSPWGLLFFGYLNKFTVTVTVTVAVTVAVAVAVAVTVCCKISSFLKPEA
jgi:hypothetical protein